MLQIRTIDNKVIIGIDAEYVTRLKEGDPILIKGEQLMLDVDIYIAYGANLQDILDELGIPGVQ